MIKEKIESPFTEGSAFLERKPNVIKYRKADIEILEHYYVCEDTKEEFTTGALDKINLNQVYNLYREKFGILFPDQIKRIRQKYDLSASKMSEILGLGTNTYRIYEQGEVPSIGNGRLILAADDPKEVKRFLRSSKEVIGEKDYNKLQSRVEHLIEEEEKNRFSDFLMRRMFDVMVPDQYTGYRIPDFEKISHMVLFFSERMETWKTKLNKLLFYSDFLAFKNSGYGISGLEYRAIQMGPVPAKFEEIYNAMSGGEVVEREYYEMESGIYGSLFKPKTTFKGSLFSEFDLEVMEIVANSMKGKKAKEVIAQSHKEKAWLENEKERNMISYKDYAFDLSI